MKPDDLIKKIDDLKTQINQLDLSTNNLLRLVPHFRLDWGSDEDNVSEDYNIGVTKPILLSKLANSKHKFSEESLLLKNNEIAQLLVDAFLKANKLSKELLLEIHSKVILHGGNWRNQDVIVSDQTYATSTFFSETSQIELQVENLIEWYNKEMVDLHPIILSTIFHYQLVKIHPFLDGNGRLARIISSLILLANRIPPPSIKYSDRAEYIYCLRKADLGNISFLCDFIAEKAIVSMEYILSLKNRNNG